MHNKGIAIILIAGLLVSGCSKKAQTSVSLEKDQILEVRSGQDFKVKLKANPTTGYIWRVDIGKAVGLISERGESLYQRQNELVGSGGIEVFTFNAAALGTADIIFFYERPWEGTPEKEYVLTVKIKK